jgi:hypothetical protein
VESALPVVQRGDELRYVTEHFSDLRGLRAAPFWAAFALSSVIEYLIEYLHTVPRPYDGELFFGMLALSGAWWAFAGHWYRRRYGMVAPQRDRIASQVQSPILSILQTKPQPTANLWFCVFLLAVLGLFLFPLFVTRPHEPFIVFGPVSLIIFLVPKVSYRCGANQWIHFRQFLAIGGMILIAFLHVGFILGHVNSWAYLGGTAAVLLFASLYDHLLLNRLLSGHHTEGRDA